MGKVLGNLSISTRLSLASTSTFDDTLGATVISGNWVILSSSAFFRCVFSGGVAGKLQGITSVIKILWQREGIVILWTDISFSVADKGRSFGRDDFAVAETFFPGEAVTVALGKSAFSFFISRKFISIHLSHVVRKHRVTNEICLKMKLEQNNKLLYLLVLWKLTKKKIWKQT